MFIVGIAASGVCAQAQQARPRVVITADPELDDNNTLIRAILYTADLDVEGLVYVSSGVHWKGDGRGTTQYIAGSEYSRLGRCLNGCTSWRWPDKDKEEFIDEIADAYAKVYGNLKSHDPNYPDPATLKSKVVWGNVEFEADYSKDTEGSNLIKRLLLDDQSGPLYVTAQGGQSTIARALKSIYDEYHASPTWTKLKQKVSDKLVIIPWGDQDGTYASYIKPNWPDVKNWQLAMIEYGYGIRNGLDPEDRIYISGPWTRQNILDRGPLGILYRVWGDGKRMLDDPEEFFGLQGYSVEQLRSMGYIPFTQPEEKDSFISEGDTPTFMNLLNNGLRANENPNWGGWGGRFQANSQLGWRPPVRINGPADSGVAPGLAPPGVKNANAPGTSNKGPEMHMPLNFPSRKISPRTEAVNAAFFAAAQNDFASRLKWSVTPKYKDANHPPEVKIAGGLELSAAPGDVVSLEGVISDPDGDKVKVRWWQYNDAGTFPGDIQIASPNALNTSFQVPAGAKARETIHVILEATDSGNPPLTRYQRLIVTVR